MIYWEDAFQTATNIINRLPTPVLSQKSPFEILYNRLPDYNFMRVFGCACWPNLRPYNKNKLNFRSKTCIFIGYSLCHQGYKCLDLSTGKIYISRHVVFDETLFPYSTQSVSDTNSNNSSSVSLPQQLGVPMSTCLPNLQTNPVITCTSPAPSVSFSADTGQQVSQAAPASPESSPPDVSTSAIPHQAAQLVPSNTHSMVTRSKNNVHRPRQISDDFIRHPLPRALIADLSPSHTEPSSYSEASKFQHWREAMNKEFSALMQNGTWTLVSTPAAANIVGLY